MSGQTRSRCSARRSHIAAAHRCLFGVALSWPAVLSGTARGVAGKGFVPLEVAVPSLLTTSPAQSRRDAVGVIIGMDPHKNSATIEVVDERGRVLAAGRYGTGKAGYADMLKAGRRFTDRVWAVEGCNGIGRHIAHRLVHDGETVLDVPAKLSAQVRVFATGNGRKTDPVDAHSVAMVALRTPNLVRVQPDPELVVMGMLARLRAKPGLAERAVEEFLRYDSPAQFGARIAVQDAKVGVLDAPEGSAVILL